MKVSSVAMVGLELRSRRVWQAPRGIAAQPKTREQIETARRVTCGSEHLARFALVTYRRSQRAIARPRGFSSADLRAETEALFLNFRGVAGRSTREPRADLRRPS